MGTGCNSSGAGGSARGREAAGVAGPWLALVVVEASLDGVPLAQVAGDTIPFWASDDVPGVQDGDFAGMAGRGYAKVRDGRINGTGPVVRPVPLIDAEAVH